MVQCILAYWHLNENLQKVHSQFEVGWHPQGGSVAEWLACWTQAQKGLDSNRSRDAVGYQSLANYSHPLCLCSPSSKMVAALLRVAGVTAGLAESNGSLLPGL